MDSEAWDVDRAPPAAEKRADDSLPAVGELGLTLSDTYGDLGGAPVEELVEFNCWQFDSSKERSTELASKRTQVTVMSLLVGETEVSEALYATLCRAVPGHELQRSRLDEAFMMCNSRRYQIIWLLMTVPVSQETLSFTTSIRYMYNSRYNQTTKIVGISDKKPDVDLQPHGIDDVLVEPVSLANVRDAYKKWSSVEVPSDPKDDSTSDPEDAETTDSKDEPTKMDEDPAPVTILPITPLMAALQEVRNEYKPRPIAPAGNDHTTKEKMRRERIKDSCDQLRLLLPYIRGRKTDMASVLEMCVDYLRILNLALPGEFKTEIAEILGKDYQQNIPKGRGEPKSTPRKRKRDLSKPPVSPAPIFPATIENSPMYTPPATPGSETGSESVASPMSVNMEHGVMSPPEPCFVKLETSGYESCVTAPKAILPQTGRGRKSKGRLPPASSTQGFAPLPHGDMYNTAGGMPVRSLDYLGGANPRRLPGCYPFAMFNHSQDVRLPPPASFFSPTLGSNLVLHGMEMEDPLGRFPPHTAFPIPTSTGLPVDPLANYVNPNAVLPVSYSSRFPGQALDPQGRSDLSIKQEM